MADLSLYLRHTLPDDFYHLHTKAYILGLSRMIEKIIDVIIEVFMNGLGSWLEACILIKKETLAQVFSLNFAKYLRAPFL